MNSNHAEIESVADMTVPACRRRGWMVLGGLSLVLVAVTAALTAADADLNLAGRFYDPGRGWFLGSEQPWQWFYRYGTIPGLVVTLAALVGWFVTRIRQDLAVWRPYCLLVVLTTLIASGILVNAVLKQYWGRPRPDQVTRFGGQWNYRDVHKPGTPGQGGSFPCGHCAMGFTLVSLFFLRRRSKLIAYAGGGAGIALGVALSITRIVQGAHFLTDTLWSLGINLIVAAALYYLVLAIPAREGLTEGPPVDRRRRFRLVVGLVVCLLLAVAAFATRRPFYESYAYPVKITPEIETLIVRINADQERFNVGYRDAGAVQVRLDSHGFGWMYFDHRVSYVTTRAGHTMILTYRVNPVSYFAELYHAIDLQLPGKYRGRLDIRLESGRDDHSLEKTVQ
jgi:lipid A 4'-phosphatase